MARRKDPQAAKEFGRNLERFWIRDGKPAMSDIEHALRDMGLVVDRETLRLYHAGQRDPAHVPVTIAVALANYYNVNLVLVHPTFVDRAQVEAAVLAAYSQNGDGYAPRDSNPEPAEYGVDLDLTLEEKATQVSVAA